MERSLENFKIYAGAITKWGEQGQMTAALEELAEVSVQIAKYMNGKNKGMEPLIDELADATIMLEQVQFNLGLFDEVDKRIEVKLARLKSIIAGTTESSHKGKDE